MILLTTAFVCSKCGKTEATAKYVNLGEAHVVVAPSEEWGYQEAESYRHMICPDCMKSVES